MKKRILVLLYIAVLSLGVTSCSDDGGGSNSDTQQISSTTTPIPQMPTEVQTTNTPIPPTVTPTMEPEPPSGQSFIGIGRASKVLITANGETLIVGGYGTLWVFDVANPAEPTHTIPLGSRVGGTVAGLSFSRDESLLAVGLSSGTVIIFDGSTFEPRINLPKATSEWAGILAISPNNQHIAVGHKIPNILHSLPVVVYDIQTGDAVFELGSIKPTDMVYTPDGSLLISGDSDTNVTFWDAAEGTQLGTLALNPDPFQGDVDFSFNAEGDVLYATENKAGVFAIDLATYTASEPFANEVGANTNDHPTLSKDGNILYVLDFDRLIRYDIATKSAQDNIVLSSQDSGFLPYYRSVYYSMAKESSITAVVTRQRGQVSIWDIEKAEKVADVGNFTGAVLSIDLSQDDRQIAAYYEDGSTVIWDITGDEYTVVDQYESIRRGLFLENTDILVGSIMNVGALVLFNRTTQESTSILRISFDLKGLDYNRSLNRIAAISPSTLMIFDAETNEAIFTLDQGGDYIYLSPDGNLVAFGSTKEAQIWNIETKELVRTIALEDQMAVFAFQPNGGFVIAAGKFSSSTKAFIFDEIDDENPSLQIPIGGDATMIRVSPNGRFTAVSRAKALVIYDKETNTIIFDESISDGGFITVATTRNLAFSSDSSFLLFGDYSGLILKIELPS